MLTAQSKRNSLMPPSWKNWEGLLDGAKDLSKSNRTQRGSWLSRKALGYLDFSPFTPRGSPCMPWASGLQRRTHGTTAQQCVPKSTTGGCVGSRQNRRANTRSGASARVRSVGVTAAIASQPIPGPTTVAIALVDPRRIPNPSVSNIRIHAGFGNPRSTRPYRDHLERDKP